MASLTNTAMTAAQSKPRSSLPFPIFKVSRNVERYLLYDIDIITWLRKTQNILGVLIGTLPQHPSQNVFLGLPLELLPEEARLLVEKGLAYICDDREWHDKDLKDSRISQRQAMKADLQREGLEMARLNEKRRQRTTQKVMNNIQNNEHSPKLKHKTTISDSEASEKSSEAPLFGEPLTRETTLTPRTLPSQTPSSALNPWTITPTMSYPPLPQPPSYSSSSIPKVEPSSYLLFKHLHNLGYFMSPGLRFGCQFSVYPGDPLRYHSHFLAVSTEWDEDFDLLDLVGGGRLGTGVKKGWLVGGFEEKDGKNDGGEQEGRVRTFCFEWGGM